MRRGLFVWFACLGALLVLFFGGQKSPLLYLVAGTLVPLPVLLTGWRVGVWAGLLLALATVLVIFALKPGLEVLLAHLGFGELLLMGVLIVGLQYRDWPPQGAIILTVVALNLLTLIFFFAQALFQGVPPQMLLLQKSGEIMETLNKVLGGAGGGTAGLLLPGFSPGEAAALMQRLLPGLVVANTGLVAWVNVILARQAASLLGWGEPEPPLFYWSNPEWLIFVALGTGFIMLFPDKGVRLFSLNLLLVLALLYFCQGVAVVAAWFHRLALPRVLRLICYPLMFLNPLFFLIITLGLMDLWLDFRRLRQSGDA